MFPQQAAVFRRVSSLLARRVPRFTGFVGVAALALMPLAAYAQAPTYGSYGVPSGGSPTLPGDIGFELPYPNGPAGAFYVSGTNVQTSGTVYSKPPSGATPGSDVTILAQAKMYIDGTEVASANGSVPGQSISLQVRWDSTNFADGKVVAVKFWGKLKNGKSQFSPERQVTVYNKYSARYLKEFESEGPAKVSVSGRIRSAFQTMKHSDAGSSIGFTSANIFNDAKVATAFHFSTHGLPGNLSAGTGGVGSATQTIRYEDIATAYRSRTAGLPGANVAFATACYTAMDGNLSGAYGLSAGEDHAYVGFDNVAFIPSIQQAAAVFWENLAQKKTARDAITAAQRAYSNDARGRTVLDHPELTPLALAVRIVNLGDPGAKLRGLYLGGSEWFTVMGAGAK